MSETKSDIVRRFIQENPAASIRQTVAATGVSRGLVGLIRKELNPSNQARPEPVPDDEFIVKGSIQEALARVLSGSATKLSAEQQAQLFSELALHPKLRPGERTAALNGLRALEATNQQTQTLGPGPPLTEAQRQERLARLMSACGQQTVDLAYAIAFPEGAPDALTP